MAYYVSSAFDTFRTYIVDLDSDKSDKAFASRNNLYTKIKNRADNDLTFPKLSGTPVPYGSFSRKTKIRPLPLNLLF